jgi:adenosine deaminase
MVAASRIRHPLDARTLARLAARYAGDGPGTVVGFGLSNDERRGETTEFAGGLRHRAEGGAGADAARR